MNNASKFLIILVMVVIAIISISLFLSNGETTAISSKNETSHIVIENIRGESEVDGYTVNFNIYNDGKSTATNVRIGIDLLDRATSRSEYQEQYIGTISAGESKQLTAYLNMKNVQNPDLQVYPNPDKVHTDEEKQMEQERNSGIRTR